MKNVYILKLIENVISMVTVSLLIISCGGNKDSKATNPILAIGQGQLAVPGGNIWYKVTGTGKEMPIVLLHGGPGMSSFYLKPFEDLGNDRQVIRYDQLGGGKSDMITDTTMFTIDHFVNELDSLRSYFGINKWHVFGHSWGTILAIEYYRAHPDYVASLTFGSAVFDIPAYAKRAKQLLTTLPDSLQQAIKKAETAGNYQDPLYQEAMNQFYSLYLVQHPIQADMDSTWATYNAGIYIYMQGPSEFTITGTLKNYNSTSLLSQIKVPALFTVGEFDEVGPELVKSFADKVPNSRYILFAGSAHMTPWDAREENVKAVRDFLNSVDSLSKK
jgi:proline-specific peptidase